MNSMIFAGGRIHPPDVIGKYAPDSVIGAVGSGVAAAASAAPKAGGGGPIRTASLEPLSLRATNQLPVSSLISGRTPAASSATTRLGVTWTGRRTGAWISTRTQVHLLLIEYS